MSKRTKRIIVWLCVLGVIVYHMVFGLWSTKALWANWLPIQGLFIAISALVLQFLVMLLFVKWNVPKKVPSSAITRNGKEDEV